ncbi:uncharacterized protein LOC109594129 isoform X1 [Aethina tumida]|uniref:uncharacterized protein LOC109594129 isoform X1 n=1 Tax=Aethina tumida TaxID=116153 RepID=UPI00096B1F76|nr:uncharacterized protein LOC109594129 isoform X1 [Aethina tumida]
MSCHLSNHFISLFYTSLKVAFSLTLTMSVEPPVLDLSGNSDDPTKKKKKKKKRDLNLSRDPSYTKLTVPYRVICANRIRETARRQQEVFKKELSLHEILQTKALDGVRLHREFANPVLENPFPEEVITLTPAQRRQLDEILTYGFYKKVRLGKCPPVDDPMYQRKPKINLKGEISYK